jgi:hypothetical protein
MVRHLPRDATRVTSGPGRTDGASRRDGLGAAGDKLGVKIIGKVAPADAGFIGRP